MPGANLVPFEHQWKTVVSSQNWPVETHAPNAHTHFLHFPFTRLISPYKCNLQSALFKLTDTADRVINRQHCGLHFSVHTWQSTEHITMIHIYIYITDLSTATMQVMPENQDPTTKVEKNCYKELHLIHIISK